MRNFSHAADKKSDNSGQTAWAAKTNNTGGFLVADGMKNRGWTVRQWVESPESYRLDFKQFFIDDLDPIFTTTFNLQKLVNIN